MIDLHTHTSYSDGADSLIELLKKAESMNLEYISITDHDNCKAYSELKNINIKDYFSGKIIPGIEIKCSYGRSLMEVLGYNVDPDKITAWADEYYKDKSKPILQAKYFDIMYNNCINYGLVMSDKKDVDFDPNVNWASVQIYKEIKKHPENEKLLPADLWAEFNVFSKKYCGNPKYPFYMDKTKDYPTLQDAIDVIKKSGGLVFIAHVFIYNWAEDKKKLLQNILDSYNIDGIECIHSDFTEEESQYLLELCKNKNYYFSGGSDYHGKNKVNIEMAIGKGNLNIHSDLVKNWIKPLYN